MKIKTVWNPVMLLFDEKVNALLAEGWILSKREVIPANPVCDSAFYAEMIMLEEADKLPDEPRNIDIFDALRAVRTFCTKYEDCVDCPIVGWCPTAAGEAFGQCPEYWTLPGEEVEA